MAECADYSLRPRPSGDVGRGVVAGAGVEHNQPVVGVDCRRCGEGFAVEDGFREFFGPAAVVGSCDEMCFEDGVDLAVPKAFAEVVPVTHVLVLPWRGLWLALGGE